MKCSSCDSSRIASVSGKCSDLCFADVQVGDKTVEHDGYVPRDMGVGGGEDVSITYCLDCGQIQGKWPLPPTELEESVDEDEDD